MLIGLLGLTGFIGFVLTSPIPNLETFWVPVV